MMKKIITSVLVLGIFLTAVAAPVSAKKQGPPPEPTAKAVDFIFVDVDSANFGTLKNFSLVNADSGNNLTANKGLVDTGDAKATTDTTTGLNTIKVGVGITDSHLGPVALNSGERLMGPSALAVDFIMVDVDSFNFGKVCNFSFANANTGANITGKYGDVTTGDAEAKTTTETTLNTISTDIKIDKSVSGPFALNLEMEEEKNAEFDMLGGGKPHGPKAIAVDFNLVDVENLNIGCVGNTSFAFANSGLNKTGKYSEVETGRALASTETETNLNKIDNKVSVSEAGLVGSVALNFEYAEIRNADCEGPKGKGGPSAIAVDGNVVLVDNMNFGMVNNLSIANANSGINITGKRSSVKTGDATASTGTVNNVNSISNTISVSSTSSGPIAMNVKLEPTPNPKPDGCLSAEFGCGGTVGTVGPVAANIGTPGTAEAKDITVVDVDNSNVATVTNTSIANANTGGNTTGCGSIPDPCGSQTTCQGVTCGGGCGDPCPTPSVNPCQPASVTTGDATATTTTTNTVNTSETTITISR